MQTIALVDPDDQACATFSAYNAVRSAWDWKSYLCVIHQHGQIVAGERGIINKGAHSMHGVRVKPNSAAGTLEIIQSRSQMLRSRLAQRGCSDLWRSVPNVCCAEDGRGHLSNSALSLNILNARCDIQ